MSLLGVNYHYVHEEGLFPYAGIYPMSPVRFKSQLIALARHFEFVSGADLLAALSGKKLPDNACIITFDDGLTCQYENALPILDELGIPALFFCSLRPNDTGKALSVHQLHYVRANCPPEKMQAWFRAFCADHDISPAGETDLAVAKQTYRYDTEEAALFKYALNHKFPQPLREKFMAASFAEIVPDEAAWCRDFYMSTAQMEALYQRGYLGSHTYSHFPLGTLSPSEITEELRQNLVFMGKRPLPFVAYPYGSREAATPQVAQEAAKYHQIGFTMERAINLNLEYPLMLARVDCNDVLEGKRPLMQVIDGKLNMDLPPSNPNLALPAFSL